VVTEEQLATLRASTGDVDVLLTQFSISSWDGNADDLERRKAGAQAMLDKMVRQTRGLHAKHVVPFASFVWFCHAENAYMNAAIRPVSDAADMLQTQTDAQPVVLYPGDCWTVGETHDSSAAIARYAADFASLPARTPQVGAAADLPSLQQAAERFGMAVKQDRSRLRLRLHAARINARQQLRTPDRSPLLNAVVAVSDELMLRVRPARIWLTDHKISLEYSLLYDLQPVSYAREECDIELSSAALLFAFKFLWGGETLQINGRFNELYPDGRIPLFEYLWIACAMNRESGALAQPL
jgi:UDP-MurNAc hydroxylase